MLIRDHWYVACPTAKLGAGQARAVQIGDEHYVVFRDAAGDPRALLDRCCHRGVRLSLGRVCAGQIACRYHGWTYDGSGKLTRIPSLGEGAELPPHSVPALPTVEEDYYVWIWVAGEHAEPTYQPRVRGLIDGLWIQQTKLWSAHIMAAVENQLDVAHTAFSHPGIYPGHQTEPGEVPPLHALEFECRADDRSVVVFAPSREESQPAPKIEDSAVAYFELPYHNYVFLHTTGTRAIYHWVPLTEGRCRLEFMGHQSPAKPVEGHTGRSVVFMDEELELLSQDRTLLESARPRYDSMSAPFERSVIADAPQLMARKVVARALEGSTRDEIQQRRVFQCWA